jgi:hypothetical protein
MRGKTIARLFNQGASASFDAYEVGLISVFFGCFGCLSVDVDVVSGARKLAVQTSKSNRLAVLNFLILASMGGEVTSKQVIEKSR